MSPTLTGRPHVRARRAGAVLAAGALALAGIAATAPHAHAADPVLLSQGAPATASSYENPDYYKASYADDGDAGTRWSSTATDNQWIQLDLGTTSTLSRVEIDWENAYPDGYKIQTSTDTTTWNDAYTTTTSDGGHDTDTLGTATTGRYLRVQSTHRATGYGISLYELRVYGTPGNTDPGDGGTDPGDGGTPGTPTDVTGPLTAPSVVKVAGGNGSWQLTVNGEPYTVKGMTWGPANTAGDQYLPDFVKLGANTLRTWGTGADSKPLLDSAAAHGVRVIAGFWLGPGGGPGSGGCPDYVNDASYKSSSMTDIINQVNSYKSHPAILIWDVGNESVLGLQNCYSGDQLEAQRAAYATFVDDVAKAIHQADPNHPVTSTDAWVGAWDYYKKYSPDLDLLAVNSYGAVCDVADYWKQGNFGKPYILTEGGPDGDWEAPKDAFGLPDEGTDQDNADGYTDAWKCLMSNTGVALGGTLFHYGIEGDYGGVWFNVIPGGNKRLSYYAVAKAFGGSAAQPGVNTPPRFASMSVDDAADVQVGGKVTIRASVSDPDGDAITYHTSLNSIGIDKATGTQEVPFTQTSPGVLQIDAPDRVGVWKVYVWAEDGQHNVGVQTVDMRVNPPTVAGTNIAQGKTATASSFDPWNGNWSPGQAVDGDLSTRWSSNWDDAEWIQVDLGSVQSFHAVQLVWESAFAKGYQVEVSNDGSTWSTVKAVTDGDGGVDTLDVNGTGRYVRIQGTARGTDYGYSLYELGIYQ